MGLQSYRCAYMQLILGHNFKSLHCLFLCCWFLSPLYSWVSSNAYLTLFLARYEPVTSPKEPPRLLGKKDTESIVWPWLYGRGCVCKYIHTQRHGSRSNTPKSRLWFLCVINSRWWRETQLSEWHSPGSHVSLTHDVLKTFLSCDHLLLTLFFPFLFVFSSFLV